MKKFVTGDIHGGFRALLQCLHRSNFRYDLDRLVVLGDTADGWSEVAECFQELLKITHLVYVRGNHDQWLLEWLKRKEQPMVWLMQGGSASCHSYRRHPELAQMHLHFLETTPFYFLDEEKRLYVHGGIDPAFPVEETDIQYLMWDRGLWEERTAYDRLPRYREVYVGHTSIWGMSHLPVHHGNVWFMDTGAGWGGKLSIMDTETEEVWQSDQVAELYPEEQGRG